MELKWWWAWVALLRAYELRFDEGSGYPNDWQRETWN